MALDASDGRLPFQAVTFVLVVEGVGLNGGFLGSRHHKGLSFAQLFPVRTWSPSFQASEYGACFVGKVIGGRGGSSNQMFPFGLDSATDAGDLMVRRGTLGIQISMRVLSMSPIRAQTAHRHAASLPAGRAWPYLRPFFGATG
jgi:hypothetical protein